MVFDTTAILYTNVLYVVMVLFPLYQKENGIYHNICRWLFVVVNGLAFVVNMCDTVYFSYTFRRTTTTIFTEFGNENNINSIIGKEVVSHWYLFLISVVIIYGLFKLYMKPRLDRSSIKSKAVNYYIAMMLSLVLFVPFCIAGMRGGWTRDTRPITISNANNYCCRPIETGLVLNTPFAMIRTIGKNKFTVPQYYKDKIEMAKIFNPIHRPTLSHPFRNKNVVVIIAESFGREYIGAYNNGLDGRKYKGYTPFLDSLIQNSLTFRYSYCNGRKSIDGMPSILSSIPMFVSPFFLSPYSLNTVSGIADCLNGKGYETAFFHGAERGSMGFLAFANATKFKKYYG
ncbi:MAG: sulfatase-like hydrolase/transferase, partial [Anaeroplasmataceae bacterium]|nr:sulfatase-like hydrolase/transferase [Anaeroplasmataceae bacterium]